MSLPLYSHTDSQLISLEGVETHLYEYLAPDLEQKSVGERSSILDLLETDLRTDDFGSFFKVYFLNGKTFINCSNPPRLGEAQFLKCEDPLKEFFKDPYNPEIEIYEDYLVQNFEFLRVISLKNPPSRVFGGSLSFIDENIGMVLNLKRFDPVHAKATLDLKRRMNFTSLFKELKDIDGEKAYEQSEEILEGVTNSDLALFRCECFFIVKAETKQELDLQTKIFLDSLKMEGASTRIEARGLAYFYQTLIPGVDPKFKRSFETPSDYLAHFIPFQKDVLHDSGLSFYARSASQIHFNLFESSAHNFNLLITGPSGQGKSMVANKLVRDEVKKGAKAVCLDLGNSFRKNALYHNASILSFRFNPFQFKSPRYLKEFILACMDEKLSNKEEGRLYETIKENVESVTSFKELIIKLEADFNGIRHYFSEIEEFFVDEITEPKDFTYCDFSEYPEVIKAPLILFLIEYFKNLQGRKIFVFDECWSLLESNADYIAECFRTFRKHEASAVAISQNMDDFSETQLGRVIIQNTYFKFFFRQNLTSSEFVTPHLKEMVGGVQTLKGHYSEFVISSENLTKPTRFIPDYLEYELFTSDPKDQLLFDEYMGECGRFLEFSRAVQNFTEIKYPNFRGDHETN